ncbi:nmrA-like family protein [Ilyonectria robusta]
MAIVTVAKGTGGVGKTIVTQLQLSDKHKVYVLSRAIHLTASPGDPEFIQVDYSNVTSVAKALEDHNIDTVISTINLRSGPAGQSQLNLISAAEKSTKTKRFVPSEFGFISSPGFGTPHIISVLFSSCFLIFSYNNSLIIRISLLDQLLCLPYD